MTNNFVEVQETRQFLDIKIYCPPETKQTTCVLLFALIEQTERCTNFKNPNFVLYNSLL